MLVPKKKVFQTKHIKPWLHSKGNSFQRSLYFMLLGKRLMDAISDTPLASGVSLCPFRKYSWVFFNKYVLKHSFIGACTRFSQSSSVYVFPLEYTDLKYNYLSCLYWVINGHRTFQEITQKDNKIKESRLSLRNSSFRRKRNNLLAKSRKIVSKLHHMTSFLFPSLFPSPTLSEYVYMLYDIFQGENINILRAIRITLKYNYFP